MTLIKVKTEERARQGETDGPKNKEVKERRLPSASNGAWFIILIGWAVQAQTLFVLDSIYYSFIQILFFCLFSTFVITKTRLLNKCIKNSYIMTVDDLTRTVTMSLLLCTLSYVWCRCTRVRVGVRWGGGRGEGGVRWGEVGEGWGCWWSVRASRKWPSCFNPARLLTFG